MDIKRILGWSNIAILGFWKEWRAVFDYLRQINYQWSVKILDQKEENWAFDSLWDYDLLIKSPWISRYLNEWIKKEYLKWKLTSWTEIFLSNCKWKIIWITWTKWKSTVSSLLYSMLNNQFWNKVKLIWNIWEAAISYLQNDNKDNIYIIELSSYQIEDLMINDTKKSDMNSKKWEYLLDYGILVNIFPDHLDYHMWFENYKKAKMNIYNISKEVISFNDTQAFNIYLNEFDFSIFKLKWGHNRNNILLAIDIAKRLWVSSSNTQKVINEFVPLNHRLQEFNFANRVWVNDSISTTPESTLAGVKVYKDTIQWIILWWLDRWYDFNELIIYLSQLKNLWAIVLLPDNNEKILKLIKDKFVVLPKIFQSKDMLAIVHFLYNNSTRNWVIALSTASPSYNLYKNFEEQWNDFIEKIKLLDI